MSVLDLDFYKLTMLQFIWKHYADVPVTFKLHSRKEDLADIVNVYETGESIIDYFYNDGLSYEEEHYLFSLGIFERKFIMDLNDMLRYTLARPRVSENGDVIVSGSWFSVTLWETVILSMVTEQYSKYYFEPVRLRNLADVSKVCESGATWADFGTRRRWSYDTQYDLVDVLAHEDAKGFIGTSNVDIARKIGVKPVGTYAHELEMVLRPYFDSEFDTTRDVLTKWQEMYPRELHIALTDTYGTDNFLRNHGEFLLDNDWRGVRLDSGSPREIAFKVNNWRQRAGGYEPWDVVFSDGLNADAIVHLQQVFSGSRFHYVNPVFGWGTGFTNPNSDLSLVMKAVESNGQKTYKITDDESKSIR